MIHHKMYVYMYMYMCMYICMDIWTCACVCECFCVYVSVLHVVEHEESDIADVWLTVDSRRDSTEESCREYSTHPAHSLCM